MLNNGQHIFQGFCFLTCQRVMNAWIIRPGPAKEGKILWTASLRYNPVHPGNLLFMLIPGRLPKQIKNITAAAGA